MLAAPCFHPGWEFLQNDCLRGREPNPEIGEFIGLHQSKFMTPTGLKPGNE